MDEKIFRNGKVIANRKFFLTEEQTDRQTDKGISICDIFFERVTQKLNTELAASSHGPDVRIITE